MNVAVEVGLRARLVSSTADFLSISNYSSLVVVVAFVWQVTAELIFKLHDVVSKQYETGTKTSMRFAKSTTHEESDSDSESD